MGLHVLGGSALRGVRIYAQRCVQLGERSTITVAVAARVVRSAAYRVIKHGRFLQRAASWRAEPIQRW